MQVGFSILSRLQSPTPTMQQASLGGPGVNSSLQKHFACASDRRQFGRRKTNLHATVRAPGRSSTPCMIRDLSPGGAQIEVAFPGWLPSRFRLTIDSTDFDVECTIVYRTTNYAGLRFADAGVEETVASRSRAEPRRRLVRPSRVRETCADASFESVLSDADQ